MNQRGMVNDHHQVTILGYNFCTTIMLDKSEHV